MREGIREEILTAAKRLFYENGYEKTTMRDIAKALDMHHTNIYYYFTSKKDLAILLYSEFYDKVKLETEAIVSRNSIYFLATSMRVLYNAIYFNKKCFTLYGDLLNSGVAEATVASNAALNYEKYAKKFNLQAEHSDFEAYIIINLALETKFINLLRDSNSPISFRYVIDLLIKTPLMYMGAAKEDINDILTESFNLSSKMPYGKVLELLSYFKPEDSF